VREVLALQQSSSALLVHNHTRSRVLQFGSGQEGASADGLDPPRSGLPLPPQGSQRSSLALRATGDQATSQHEGQGRGDAAGGRRTDPGPCGVRARSSLPDQLSDAAAAVRRPARGCRCLATSRDRADSTLGRLVSLSAPSARSIQEGTRTGLPPDWSSTRFVPPPAASAAGCRRTKAEPGQFERLPGR